LVPFGYFYYEEEDPLEPDNTYKQVCGALKYTVFCLVFVVVLMIVGIVIANKIHHTEAPGSSLKLKLENVLSHADYAFGFIIAFVTLLGLLGWVTYTAFGMVRFPLNLFPKTRVRSNADVNPFELRTSLLKTEGKLDYLELRKNNEGSLSRKDEIYMKQLKAEKRRLEQQNAELAEGKKTTCCQRCSLWCIVSYPVRVALSIFCGLVSLLIFVSFFISLLDRGIHSTCNFSCGFAVDSFKFKNPLNLCLVYLSKYFPLDYVLFGVIAVHLFLSSLSGLIDGGVRLVCFKIYDIRPRKTMQNALLLGIWFLCFVLIAIDIQMMTLLPQYAVFGSQTDGGKQCTVSSSSSSSCVMSTMSHFSSITNLIPFFGVVNYFAGLIFCLAFTISVVVGIKKLRQNEPKYESFSDDDDDLEI